MKKIKENTLEEIKKLCYDILAFEMICSQSMYKAKNIAIEYLMKNEFSIHSVKCDLENNPSEVIDSQHIHIDIYEKVIEGSSEFLKHKIIL
jgi:hypothetical protein